MPNHRKPLPPLPDAQYLDYLRTKYAHNQYVVILQNFLNTDTDVWEINIPEPNTVIGTALFHEHSSADVMALYHCLQDYAQKLYYYRRDIWIGRNKRKRTVTLYKYDPMAVKVEKDTNDLSTI